MLLHVSSLGEQPMEGSAGELPLSDAEPLSLTLQLLDDELLDAASLVLRRTSAAGPSITPVALDTSAGGSWVGVEWVTASWGRAQHVRALSLAFTSKPNPLIVRVSIARGGSSWFLAPGPHTFTLGAAMQLHVELPDTVAERMLVELFDAEGAAVAVDLSGVDPVVVQLGREPRDLDLRIRGRRPLLRWNGAIPAGSGLVVDDLRTRLETELGTELRALPVTLELRAAVAGEIELEWVFGAMRVAERFAEAAPARTLSLPWAGVVDEPLPLAHGGAVNVEAITLAVGQAAAAEQLVPGHDGSTSGDGQLVRPLYDAAQVIVLQQGWTLTGVDVLARTLTERTSIDMYLCPDSAGRPAANALIELHRSIDTPLYRPDWVGFDIASPVAIDAGVWWIVLRVEEGELVWLTAALAEPRRLLHRRDRATWIERASTQGAMVRLRAKGEPPAHPVALSLRGTGLDGAEPWEAPLVLADDGIARWSVGDDPAPPASSQLSLRLAADIATTVVLSNLELRYRPSAP